MTLKTLSIQALLATVSIAGIAAPAFAQDVPQDNVAEAATDEAGSGDIIVTAQRREQRLQDVPLSISVVSDEALAASNFTTVADVQFLSPGVNYNANFGGGFNVRGVGTQSLLITAEQSVALVIDDVIQGLPEVSFAGPSYQTMGDVERIEVLKGPQGTLFGKNASAGVIQIVTKNPSFDGYSVDGSLSYATRNEVNLYANLNVPISDTVALRLSSAIQRRDGFVENRFTGEDLYAYERYNFRAKLLLQPTDALKILLSADYRNLRDNANGQWTIRNCGSGFLGFQPCSVLAGYGVVAGPTNLAGAWDGLNQTKQESYTFSGRVDYDLGGATLTSITAYRDLYQPIAVDTDNTPRPIYSYNHNNSGGTQFTQELRLNGQAGILDYTVGGFYYDARPFQEGINGGTYGLLPDSSPIILSFVGIGPFASSGGAVRVKAKVKSWAAFGQLEAELFPGLTVIGGARYTKDDVSQTIGYFPVSFLCRSAFASGGTCNTADITRTDSAAIKTDKFTYKGTVKFDITPDINIYASYGTGYKGPMIAYPSNRPQQLVQPEESESWEVGLKAQLFDRRLTFNIAAFKVDYDNFQGQQRVGTAPNFYYTTTNAGGLQTKGIEVDASWRVTDWFTLSGNFAYTPTKFTEFSVQCYDRYTNPATPVGQCNYQQPGTPVGTALQFNAAGYPLIYSPETTINVMGDVSLPTGNGMTFDAHASYSWRSSTYGIIADPNSINPGYGLLNGQLSFGREDGRWRVSVFARNLLDEYFVAGILRTPLDSGTYNSSPLSTIGYANIPALDSSRTVGVKVEFKFGQ